MGFCVNIVLKEGRLNMSDTTAHAVKTMIEFLYVGRLNTQMASDEIAEVSSPFFVFFI